MVHLFEKNDAFVQKCDTFDKHSKTSDKYMIHIFPRLQNNDSLFSFSKYLSQVLPVWSCED